MVFGKNTLAILSIEYSSLKKTKGLSHLLDLNQNESKNSELTMMKREFTIKGNKIVCSQA